MYISVLHLHLFFLRYVLLISAYFNKCLHLRNTKIYFFFQIIYSFMYSFIHSPPSLQLLIEEHGIDLQALFINTVWQKCFHVILRLKSKQKVILCFREFTPQGLPECIFLSSLFICRKAGSVTSPRNKSLWLCAQFQAVWRSLTMVGCCTWIYKYINGTNKLNYLSSLHATPWYMTTRIIYLISVLFNHNSSAGWLFGGGGFWHPKDRLKGSLKELGCFFCPVCKSLSVPLSNM